MDALGTYLNDHLAGSAAAIELVDHLIKIYDKHPLRQFFVDLRREISADQDELERLIKNLGEDESSVKKAGAWLMEKLGRAKLDLSDKDGEFGLLQGLEALVLGISGKAALWRILRAVSSDVPALQRLDYARLEARAIEQHDLVERKRIETATALVPPSKQ
ncbi:MAG: hypothetical protein ACR2MF_08980 [Chthoniobacterales bacterium]